MLKILRSPDRSARPARRSRFALVGLAAALVASGAAPAQAQWQTETISRPGALQVQDLAFDRQNRTLAMWEGFDQQRNPQRYTSWAVRDPAGNWQPEQDLAGITWGQARLHTYATTRTLLVAQRRVSPAGATPTRHETVAAFGRSDGSIGTLRPLGGRDTSSPDSAVNRNGDVIVAWGHRTRGDIQVAERAGGRSFRSAVTRSPRGASRHTVAMNARGDRVLAWVRRGADRQLRVEARIRRKGGSWGSVLRVGPADPVPEGLRATVSPTGRILVGWSGRQFREGQPSLVEARVGIRNRSGGWVSRRLDRFTAQQFPPAPRAIPIFDAAGRAYISWVGPAAGGHEVKLAQIATTAVRPPAVVSDGARAVLEDVAGAPGGDLAIAWSTSTQPGPVEVAVTRRTGREGFEPPERLSAPGDRPIAGGSERARGDVLVGFDPVSSVLTALWVATEGDRGVVRASTQTG